LLKASSIVSAVQAFGHLILFISAKPRPGKEKEFILEMQSLHFRLGGFETHSYWDLYFGYGLLAVLSCLMQAFLLWQLALLIKTNGLTVGNSISIFIFAILCHAILLLTYFSFLIPIAFDLAVITILIFAKLNLRRN
jgi:hypothetical protein